MIFSEFYKALCSFACKYLNDRDEAEDVVQEVFIELWNQRERFLEFNHVKSFLYLSVKNKCLNRINHLKVKESFVVECLDDKITESFENHLIKAEVVRQIRYELDQLPMQRKKIILLNMQGLKNEEIAEDLEISINTVKLQKKIAYEQLRQKLGDIVFNLFF
jgi:RNA polymerase sigma-70 factor (family 1)